MNASALARIRVYAEDTPAIGGVPRRSAQPDLGASPAGDQAVIDGARRFRRALAAGGRVSADNVWVATRRDPAQKFTAIRNRGKPVNSPSSDGFSDITSDGRTLYFSSDRPGGAGGSDL